MSDIESGEHSLEGVRLDRRAVALQRLFQGEITTNLECSQRAPAAKVHLERYHHNLLILHDIIA